MGGMLARYDALVAAGELRPDVEQAAAASRLDALQRQLEAEPPRGLLKLFRKAEPVRGAYLWGGVGRGKSMLMDLFHQTLAIEEKRRVHFHAFMIEVHQRLRDARQSEEGDPIPQVAATLAENLRCLAFDEMVVSNSADAMIMSRLFRALIIDEGVTVVTTSNRPPHDLYKDGLNRELFIPFIQLIERRMLVVEVNGPTDYRLDRLTGVEVWHVPNGPEATTSLAQAFFQLTDYPVEDRAKVPSEDIDVGGGRTLHVPKSLKGVAVFSFKRLCGEPRGSADYLAIARRYHTVIVVGIPVMGSEGLYPQGDGSFEFQRTVSRLEEMRSAEYLAEGHGVVA